MGRSTKVLLASAVLLSVSVSACGGGSGGDGGAIGDVADAKKGVIQIIAQGSFVSAESGQLQTKVGAGSGFIIDSSGIAVTNQHVVEGAGSLDVFVGGSTKGINAKILGVSECNDLAVIDLEGDGYDYFEWYDGSLDPGLEVFAAGFPLGDPEYTLTDGIVAKAQADGDSVWASLSYAVEHSANIQPGNSGGPLLTKDGKIAAVNFAGGSPTNTEQFFAIPAALAREIVNVLKTGVDQDSIGINGEALWNEEQQVGGLWVSGVRAGSPAANAGVLAGDIVTQLQGREVVGQYANASKKGYCDVLRTVGSDKPMSITLYRSSTGESLSGEINNPARPLTVTSRLSDAGGNQDDSSSSPVTDTTTVSDEYNIISVDLPSDWSADSSTDTDSEFGTYSMIKSGPSGTSESPLAPGVLIFVFNKISSPKVKAVFEYVRDSVVETGECGTADSIDKAPQDWESGVYMGAQWFDCGAGTSVYIQVFSEDERGAIVVFVGVYGGDTGIGNDVINAVYDNLVFV
ncbi:MAG: S1C family serine protease [Ilumatobacteraceae bacterium]